MKMVFMGTPPIAARALGVLLGDGCDVAAVYTRADKPQGRKQLVTPSPVKLLAAENGIPVYQTESLRQPGEAEKLAEIQPDLIVVVAYGLLLPRAVLQIPPKGCINLHVSLLPAYRGAAPVQWAVINGEQRTGVSVMRLDEGLDTGPLLRRQAFEIPPNATAGEVLEQAADMGARLLAATVKDIEAGHARATPQSGPVTLAPQLDKSMAQMDFARPAAELHNLVRGCNPWPLAWFESGGKKVKVLRASMAGSGEPAPAPGTLVSVSPLTVACGGGALVLEQVHPEGSRAMPGKNWAAGRRFAAGDRL